MKPARTLLESATMHMVDDPASDVVWAGEFEGRWGIRMAQQVRDFTTVWFDVGDLTVGSEAYVGPMPPHDREEVFALMLSRNWPAWRTHFALDKRRDLFLVGRVPVADFTEDALDELIGSTYELIETTFRQIIRLGFSAREK